jgi:hypothetical protein
MFEKVVLAVAIACALYLNIQIKPQPKTVEIGVNYPVEILHRSQSVVLMTI